MKVKKLEEGKMVSSNTHVFWSRIVSKSLLRTWKAFKVPLDFRRVRQRIAIPTRLKYEESLEEGRSGFNQREATN